MNGKVSSFMSREKHSYEIKNMDQTVQNVCFELNLKFSCDARAGALFCILCTDP